jgi:hypothetical protein
MKWYFLIRCDNTVENPLITGKANLKGFDEWDFARGKLIENWDNTAWFRAEEPEDDGDPDDVLQNHLGLPIYSKRLRAALEKGGIRGIQYLPVHIFRPNGALIEGFAIANILNLISALDFDESDYDVFPNDYFLLERRGLVRGVRKSVLKGDRLQNYDIIRLAEFELNIYTSEQFKEIFNKNNFTGYSFHEVKLS